MRLGCHVQVPSARGLGIGSVVLLALAGGLNSEDATDDDQDSDDRWKQPHRPAETGRTSRADGAARGNWGRHPIPALGNRLVMRDGRALVGSCVAEAERAAERVAIGTDVAPGNAVRSGTRIRGPLCGRSPTNQTMSVSGIWRPALSVATIFVVSLVALLRTSRRSRAVRKLAGHRFGSRR